MSDDDPKSRPPSPMRRKFLVTSGSGVAASLVAGSVPALAQLASEKTGVPLDKIEVELGDGALPDSPISGGSLATSSVIPAVFKAADQAIASLLIIAVKAPGSPFLGHRPEDLALENGRIFVKAEGTEKGVPFGDLLRRRERTSGHGQRQF